MSSCAVSPGFSQVDAGKPIGLLRLLGRLHTVIYLFFCDHAADYERYIGSPWRPRTGSKVNHRDLTVAVIDGRDFLAARRRADTEGLVPPGLKVAFTGGLDFNDHRAVWDRLNQVHAKLPDMVLLHGGSPRGAELIATKWAAQRNVPQIAFKPDGRRTARPRRSSATTPCSRSCRSAHRFLGTGIQANVALEGDAARHPGLAI